MFSFLRDFPLLELFYRADVRLLLGLNHFVAARPTLYALALFLTDKGSEILVLGTFLLLWFGPRDEQDLNRTLFGSADLSRRQAAKKLSLRQRLASALREDEYQPIIARVQSRAQVLLWGTGALIAYVVARLLASLLAVSRPIASYWIIKSPPNMAGTFESLRASGAFPSGHAALIAGFACALFFWNRRLGLLWTALAIILSACRVAVGFHYPMDVLGGAVVGLLCVWPLLLMYRRQGALFRRANDLARAFDFSNAPYCYLLYFLLILAGLEATSHFNHVLQVFFSLGSGLFHAPRF